MSASRRAGGENIEPLANGKKRDPLKTRRLRGGADRLAHHRNAKKTEHDRRNRGDEFDVGLDESLLVTRRDLAHVNRGGNAERHGNDQRDDRDHDRADEQRNDPIPILPKTRRHPFATEKEGLIERYQGTGASGDQARNFSAADWEIVAIRA